MDYALYLPDAVNVALVSKCCINELFKNHDDE